jgi:tRNA 2-thiouridine synthesizing protein A
MALAAPIAFDDQLDCLGEPCPLPIIKTAARLPALPGGAVLEVLSDDPGILPDMEHWCASQGQEYVGFWEETIDQREAWRVYVRKAHAPAED